MFEQGWISGRLGGMKYLPSLIGLVIWILCLVDFLKPDASAYESNGTSKTLWVVLSVFFSWIAWLIFNFTGKRAAVRTTAGL